MATTILTFLATGNPTGLMFALEHGPDRVLFEAGMEHAPGLSPFSLGLEPRFGRELADLLAAGMAPAGTGVLGAWDGRTHLFVSHLHLDHTALVRWVHPEVPLHYPAAMEELRAACERAGHVPWRRPPGRPVEDRGHVRAGAIDVEFVAVDHDLPGASGFLVRTPDLFAAFTGDHRWHGCRPELTAAFAEAARGADVLIQEGVTLGLAGDEDWWLDEAGVVEGFRELLARAAGLVVVNLYPMNRERVRALGVACAEAGRELLLEPDAGQVAGWPRVWTDVEEARRRPGRFCLQLSFESLPRLLDLEPPAGSLFVHSDGAPLGEHDPHYRVMTAWPRALGMEWVSLSSSGHSRPGDVARMVESVRPRLVLPVHSRRPEALRVPGVPRLLPVAGRGYPASQLLGGRAGG